MKIIFYICDMLNLKPIKMRTTNANHTPTIFVEWLQYIKIETNKTK